MTGLDVMVNARAPIALDVAFAVKPGEMLALVGHSGSGKSTLLRIIAGLWRPESARVSVNGKPWLDTALNLNLPPHLRRVGIVFQNYALFPHMSAEQNVMAAMDRPDRDAARKILKMVRLEGLGARKPAELSGGQQQRVAVARALARQPDALLLDEPFSAVDRTTRDRLYGEIIALRKELDMPVVLVTHDMNEAQLLADRIVIIDKGRMVANGPTATVMSDPDALRAMGLREAAAMISATLRAHHDDAMSCLDTVAGPIWLPRVNAAPGARVRLRIMAHEVILSRARPEGLSAQNILNVRVIDLRMGEGPAVMVRLALGDEVILARVTRRAAEMLNLQPGDPVHAVLKSMSVARDHISADSGA